MESVGSKLSSIVPRGDFLREGAADVGKVNGSACEAIGEQPEAPIQAE